MHLRAFWTDTKFKNLMILNDKKVLLYKFDIIAVAMGNYFIWK